MKRFTLEQVQTSERFYRIPKALFESSKYQNMKVESKVAYAILKDRFELSIKNKWIDENNDVYLLFSNTSLVDLLGFSEQKVIKIKKELEKFGLLEQVRQGLNKPNRLYIGNVEIENDDSEALEPLVAAELPNSQFRNFQNGSSRTSNSAVQELPKWQSNDTEYSDTETKEISDDEEHVDKKQFLINDDKKIEQPELLDHQSALHKISEIILRRPEIRELSCTLFDELMIGNPVQAISVIDAIATQYESLLDLVNDGNQQVLFEQNLWGETRGLIEIIKQSALQQISYMSTHLADSEHYGSYFARGLKSRVETFVRANQGAVI